MLAAVQRWPPGESLQRTAVQCRVAALLGAARRPGRRVRGGRVTVLLRSEPQSMELTLGGGGRIKYTVKDPIIPTTRVDIDNQLSVTVKAVIPISHAITVNFSVF